MLFGERSPASPVLGRYLGQLHKLYLAFEEDDGLVLYDQHAAAERVLYERLLASLGAEAAKQPLLTPLLLELSPSQAETLRAYAADFEALGFCLEPLGATSFVLKEWPVTLREARHAKRFVDETLEALASERPKEKAQIYHEIAARAACRAAVMAGDSLSPVEAQRIVIDLFACERPMTCPHGRPTHLRFSAPDLEKRFRRA
jgi:DNA mismatch repair protein MutL